MHFNDPTKLMIFGVDLEAKEVVLFGGTRFPVHTWVDIHSQECESSVDAVACTFRGPGGFWFGIDFRTLMIPVYTN